MKAKLLLPLFAALVLCLGAASSARAACSTGVTNCSTDTTSDNSLQNAAFSPQFMQRVWYLAIQQCASVYSEAITSAAVHGARASFCNNIANGTVSQQSLVASVLNATIVPEILAGTGCGQGGTSPCAGGNATDVDINTAIGALLTVSGGTTVSTTTNGAQAAAGEAVTLTSGTGVLVGQNVYCTGCAAGTTVAAISGTALQLSSPTTAALGSGTAIVFVTPLSGAAVGNF